MMVFPLAVRGILSQMIYKKKSSPLPGEIINAKIQEVSIVDSPANGRKFLLKKREEKMDEKLKKKLIDMGFNAEKIEKMEANSGEKLEKAVQAIEDLGSENISDDVKQGFMDKLKKVFAPKENNSDIKAVIEPLIKKIESLEEKLVKNGENPALKENNSDIEKKIQELEKTVSELEKGETPEATPKLEDELTKKFEALTKKVEALTKMRTGGNNQPKEGNPSLTQEELEKRKKTDLFKNTAFDFNG